MSDEDRERLMELCRKEIYAQMLGADYKHDEEDQRWWQNLKQTHEIEFDWVIRAAKREYGYDDWKWRTHGASRESREKA
jgi:hypothetical protein